MMLVDVLLGGGILLIFLQELFRRNPKTQNMSLTEAVLATYDDLCCGSNRK